MKRRVGMVLVVIAILVSRFNARAQDVEIEQLLLNIEKLSQLKTMLNDLKQGYQIVYSGYEQIKNISQENFNLHEAFLDGLLQVSPSVQKYYKVKEVISGQLQFIKEYKASVKGINSSSLFTAQEIEHLGKVYKKLFNSMVENLDALALVLTDNVFRMSDNERLSSIDDIHNHSQQQLQFLRKYTNANKRLLLQRAKEQKEINTSKKLYGINK
jgi:hypothetical protein